ncbi:C-type lectin-like isoform X6 [Sphaerodactylus townsendi]|uniref:C-type lectin-like isoform X6 n=1 Tax=Sphaerodactylus townsendi TaxID=933632 RepID=UPI002027627F|nr:C-type lectin-like isoform X6 [Sphaerodactylus townsendi]
MGLLPWVTLAFCGFLVAGPGPRGVEAISCPGGWMFYQGHCYGFFQDKMTWAEAEIDCQSQGPNGHLASISSKAEGAVLARHIKASQQDCQHVWIGLHDPQRNRRWRWSDRSIVNYRSWGLDQPDNFGNNEYCGHILCDKGYLEWNDVNCKYERRYICEFVL